MRHFINCLMHVKVTIVKFLHKCMVKTIITAGSEISKETVRVWLTEEESLITEEKATPGGLCKNILYADIEMVQYVFMISQN